MWSTELKEVLLSHSTFWLTFFILLGVTLLLLNRVRFHLIAVLGKIEQGRFPIRHCNSQRLNRCYISRLRMSKRGRKKVAKHASHKN